MSTPSRTVPLDAIVRRAQVVPRPGPASSGSAAGSRPDAIAISDGGIVAVGTWEDVREDADGSTRILDAGGRVVVPAFIDAHTHFHRGAVLGRCFLDVEAAAPRTVEALLALVAERSATLPDGAWLEGDGLSAARYAEKRFPDRHELDRAAGGRPVVLRGIGKHVVAASSAALAAAGIDRTTEDPPGGRIERDEAGDPTGVLHESAKLRLDTSRSDTVVPPVTPKERRAAVRDAVGDLHRAGIATIHEMIRMPEEAADLAALHAAGELGVRVRLYYRVHESPLSLDWLLDLGVRHGRGDDWFKVLGIKISIDGFCIFRNAAVYEPYKNEPENRGLLRIEPDRLDDLVARAAANGLQVAVHAVGPRAVDLALDAFERASQPTVAPHRLEHAYLDLDPTRIERIRRSGAVWSTQPSFLGAYRREWADAFEPDRIDHMMPIASGLRAGLPLILDSDYPCAPYDPVSAIRLAVERRCLDGSPHPERIDTATAWQAMTTTPADVAGDGRLGRIEPGAKADLVVLDGDPFAAGADLASVGVRSTLVDGIVVFGDDLWGG
ncbi:MAG TPA: amidohydrolase [Candidatus Limnocylindrales bacterium]